MPDAGRRDANANEDTMAYDYAILADALARAYATEHSRHYPYVDPACPNCADTGSAPLQPDAGVRPTSAELHTDHAVRRDDTGCERDDEAGGVKP